MDPISVTWMTALMPPTVSWAFMPYPRLFVPIATMMDCKERRNSKARQISGTVGTQK